MRVIEKKRPSYMTKKRWIILIVLSLITLGILFGYFFRDIQSPRWSEEKEAREIALATNLLKEVNSIQKHVWDQTTWVTEGIDLNDQILYLFHNKEELLYSVDASVTMTREELESKFKSSNPSSEVIRVVPALFQGKPAWEVYYSLSVDGKQRYNYDFYTFDHDMKLLDTYKLPTKTGP